MKLRRALLMPLLLLPLVAGTVLAPPATAGPSPHSASSPAPLAAAAASTAAAASGDTAVNGIFTGRAFDTCEAPNTTVMQKWKTYSPYGAVGIYIGGVNRSCAQPNLTSSWISTVHAQGWFTLPIYVGRQAPCTDSAQKINGSQAGAQGSAAAADAVSNMVGLGLGAGNPIYLDIENYDRAAAGCSAAVKGFVSAFVGGVKARGYIAGVYGGANSITSDLVSWRADARFQRPDVLWYARWDHRATTLGEPTLPTNLWFPHRRVHQYMGPHDEAYGPSGAVSRINIDSNMVDAYVTGAKMRMLTSAVDTRLTTAADVPLVTGGTPPYSVAVTSGSLPAGLGVSGGRLVGTPTRAGVQTVQLTVSDSGSPRRAVPGTLRVTVDFTDVPPTQAFHGDILWTAQQGTVTGYADGTFRPQTTVTRQDLAVMIARYSGAATPACTTAPFTDVPQNSPFCAQIAWAKRTGLISGFPVGGGRFEFRPSGSGSRQDLVLIISRFVGGARHACTSAPFTDVPRTNAFCAQISWAAQRGLVSGFGDGSFRPQQAGSRQDAAVVLHRLNAIRPVG